MRTYLAIILATLATSVYSQSTFVRTGVMDTILAINGNANDIWLATEADGVKSYNKQTGIITTYNTENGTFPDNDFRSILCVDETVYAGSNFSGLYMFTAGSWIHFDTTNSPLPGNSVRDLLYDAVNDALWIATDKGLANKQGESWIIYDSINSPLAGNYLTCLFQSADGILWIGTKYSGLSKFSDGSWETFDYSNSGINNNGIRAITQDEDGYLYVADYLGINKYDIDDDNWLFVYNQFTVPMTSERVNRMGFDDDDNFWMATHGGVTMADSTNHFHLFYTTNSNLPSNTCDALFIDDDNTVWIGTYGGLVMYRNISTLPEIQNLSVSISPNPASNIIQINVDQAFDLAPAFSIYNLQGKQLIQTTGSAIYYGRCQYALDISNLAAGAYVLVVGDNYHSSAVVFTKTN